MSSVTSDRSGGQQLDNIVYFGICIDNADPLRAGRIIAFDDVSFSASDAAKDVKTKKQERRIAIENGDFVPWSSIPGEFDPDVHAPFLPLNLTTIPKNKESIKILYYNGENKGQNKLYVGPDHSYPHLLENEGLDTARYHTSQAKGWQNPPLPVTLNPDSDGVFPNPKDIAIQGRNNTDMILGMSDRLPDKKEDSKRLKGKTYTALRLSEQPEIQDHPQILIRAGKFIKNTNNKLDSQPLSNKQLSFVQLNHFPQTLKITEESKGKSVELKDEKVQIIFEYDIQLGVDPIDFTTTTSPLPNIDFTMGLSLLPNMNRQGETQSYMASEVDLETNFLFSDAIMVSNFTLNKDDAIKQINHYLTSFDQHNFVEVCKIPSGTTGTNNPHYGFSPVNETSLKKKLNTSGMKGHPIYFRPGPNIINFLTKNDPAAVEFSIFGSLNSGNFNAVRDSIIKFTEEIFLEGVESKGYGLAFTSKPDKRKIPTESKEEVIRVVGFDEGQQGYVTLGSQNIYLLSHKSKELGDIELLNNYGISQLQYVDDIDNKTNSLVRGEKLLDLLGLIVDFTVSHTHAFPGMAPVPTSHGGGTTQDILNKLLKAHDEVLNKNIRIN
tara:strand:- start:1061 stop:2881 length:1821 start_codon:yes stop_codon:yes gene_type:complete